MVKILENNNIFFNSKHQNKATDLNSFEMAQVMPEIFEMFNRPCIHRTNLVDFPDKISEESKIFSGKFCKDS